VAVRQQSLFSLPDANVIVPDRNYTASVDLGREDERALGVGYGVLCHRFDLSRGASINNSTGVEGDFGVESCTKRKRIALSCYCLWPAVIRSGQNHIGWFVQRSPKNPATKIMTTTTPSPDEDERQFRVWQFSFARYQLLTVNSLEHIGELPRPLLR
jgi:hypothetical protein